MNMVTADYSERTAAMNGRAKRDSKARLYDLLRQRKKLRLEAQESIINILNSTHEIALTLQGLCGHEQMQMSFFEHELGSELPEDLRDYTFEDVQRDISLSRRMGGRVETILEARRFVQLAMGIDEQERQQPQSASSLSQFQKFLKCFTLMKAPLKKIELLRPMNGWDEEDLGGFLKETEWVAERREEAQQLIEAKEVLKK